MYTTIPVFLSGDENYAPFVASTIASICDNTDAFVDFHILDGGICSSSKNKIELLKKRFDNFSIEFIKIDIEKEFKSIEYKNHGKYISISTYNRFLIPYLKHDIEKALYLDTDIVALGDILKLYDIDLGDYALGAAAENKKAADNMHKQLKFKSTHKYFNAGILLLDCNKWRNQNITEKLFEIERQKREVIEFADQDILNIYFEDNYLCIDDKYNWMNLTHLSKKPDGIIIRHFIGQYKPWQINPNTKTSLLTNKDDFWKYAKLTNFYDDILCKTTNEKEQQDLLRHLHIMNTVQKQFYKG